METRLLQCGRALFVAVQWCGRGLAAPKFRTWSRRFAGAVCVAYFLSLLLPLWHPVYRFTGLLQIDRANEHSALAVVREQPILFSDGGYDGQYYAQIACDPTLRSPGLRTAIDNLAYRARRILVPALAWALGGGRPENVLHLYSWLNVVCWFALAVLLWPMLDAERSWRGVAAWAGVLLSAGAVASVRYSLTDLPGVVLLVLAFRAAERGRTGGVSGWLAATLLARETLFAGTWGLVPRRFANSRALLRAAGWLVLALVPLVAWLAYIRWQVGPSDGGLPGNFAWPGVGLVERWRESLAALGHGDPRLEWASLLGTVAVTAQVALVLSQFELENRWWRLGAGFVVLALVLGGAVWEGFPGAANRVLLPLLIAANALALRRRWAWLWLLLINLSIPAAVVEMDPGTPEVAAERAEGRAILVRRGEGTYGPEQLGRSWWIWVERDAAWRVQCWGGPAEVTITARARSLDEREVAIFHAETELWRGHLNPRWTAIRLRPFRVTPGETTLTIKAVAPGVAEAATDGGRSMSACFLEPRIVVRALEGE
ncbi:MAG TPA: hypothetical protein VK178_18150 [Opitutaceae bacterium]|nr:hypothetical protein [Opitutaceae bacterium]